MIIGALTGGLSAAYAISQHSFSLDFSGYNIFPLILTVAASIGGIAPDIDMPRSVSGRFFRHTLRFFLVISAAALGMVFISPYLSLPYIGGAMRASAAIAGIYPIILAVICVVLLFTIEKAHHRGLTHTVFLLAVISLPAVYMVRTHLSFPGADIVLSAQIGFLLGWCSHLVIDTFNRPGVPWLWPLTKRHFSVMGVKSGTGQETVFRNVAVIAFAAVYIAIGNTILKTALHIH